MAEWIEGGSRFAIVEAPSVERLILENQMAIMVALSVLHRDPLLTMQINKTREALLRVV